MCDSTPRRSGADSQPPIVTEAGRELAVFAGRILLVGGAFLAAYLACCDAMPVVAS